MFVKILTVAGLATFQLLAAVPAGFAFGLPVWIIWSASIAGNLTSLMLIAFFGAGIKKLIFKKKNENATQKKGLSYRLWTKHGVFGLGFIGTLIIGAPICLAAGVGLNAPFQKLLTWCVLGVVARCTALILISYFGLKIFF